MHFSLLKATGAQMAKYMQDNFAYDFQMYPGQRYVKDQCILFMQHIMWNCSRNVMTVQEMREGLENLHSLLYILSTRDVSAFRVSLHCHPNYLDSIQPPLPNQLLLRLHGKLT